MGAFEFEEAVTPSVGLLRGLQGLAAESPAGDHLVTSPAAGAGGLQIHSARKRRAVIPIGVKRFPAFRAFEGK